MKIFYVIAASCILTCIPKSAVAQSDCQPVWDAMTAWQSAADDFFAYDPYATINPAEIYRSWCIQNAGVNSTMISDCNYEFEEVYDASWNKYYELNDARYLAEFNYQSALLTSESQGLTC